MIQFPFNPLESARVQVNDRAIFLHFVNDACQFVTFYFQIDPALPLSQTLENIGNSLSPLQLAGATAYILDDHLAQQPVEPSDQNWRPAPLPTIGMISLEQFKQLQEAPGA